LRRDKGEERAIATRRIDVLLGRARIEALARRGDLAARYVRIGLEVAQKHQSGLTRAQKALVCRACGAFRIPGRTSRTRIAGGKVATTCLGCGHVARRPLRGTSA
jgi:RNase P subunit RPR2